MQAVIAYQIIEKSCFLLLFTIILSKFFDVKMYIYTSKKCGKVEMFQENFSVLIQSKDKNVITFFYDPIMSYHDF